MSATRFSIMELLGGQVGVTHTRSRADAASLSARVLPLATVEPIPWIGTAVVSRCSWEGPGALTGRGHARLVGTRRSGSRAESFSLCLETRWCLGTTHNGI